MAQVAAGACVGLQTTNKIQSTLGAKVARQQSYQFALHNGQHEDLAQGDSMPGGQVALRTSVCLGVQPASPAR